MGKRSITETSKTLLWAFLLATTWGIYYIECSCGEPETIPNASNNSTAASSYEENVVIEYTCDSGHRVIGISTYKCSGGTWILGSLICTPLRCSKLMAPDNGRITGDFTRVVGSWAYFSCDTGYDLIGTSAMLCRASREWRPAEPPSCRPKSCGTFETVLNARTWQSDIGGQYNVYGSVVEVTCNEGYIMIGNFQATCTADGQWSERPTCRPSSCPQHPGLNSSCIFDVDAYITDGGGILSFLCEESTEQVSVTEVGPSTVFCENDEWDHPESACYCDCKILTGANNFTVLDLENGFLRHGKKLQWVCEAGTVKSTEEPIRCYDGMLDTSPACLAQKTTTTETPKTTKHVSENTLYITTTSGGVNASSGFPSATINGKSSTNTNFITTTSSVLNESSVFPGEKNNGKNSTKTNFIITTSGGVNESLDFLGETTNGYGSTKTDYITTTLGGVNESSAFPGEAKNENSSTNTNPITITAGINESSDFPDEASNGKSSTNTIFKHANTNYVKTTLGGINESSGGATNENSSSNTNYMTTTLGGVNETRDFPGETTNGKTSTNTNYIKTIFGGVNELSEFPDEVTNSSSTKTNYITTTPVGVKESSGLPGEATNENSSLNTNPIKTTSGINETSDFPDESTNENSSMNTNYMTTTSGDVNESSDFPDKSTNGSSSTNSNFITTSGGENASSDFPGETTNGNSSKNTSFVTILSGGVNESSDFPDESINGSSSTYTKFITTSTAVNKSADFQSEGRNSNNEIMDLSGSIEISDVVDKRVDKSGEEDDSCLELDPNKRANVPDSKTEIPPQRSSSNILHAYFGHLFVWHLCNILS